MHQEFKTIDLLTAHTISNQIKCLLTYLSYHNHTNKPNKETNTPAVNGHSSPQRMRLTYLEIMYSLLTTMYQKYEALKHSLPEQYFQQPIMQSP